LFLQAGLFQLLKVSLEGSVEDGRFGAGQLEESVVDAAGRKCSHDVFDGLDPYLPFGEARTQVRSGNVVQIDWDLWGALQVGSLEADAMIGRCGAEGQRGRSS
jgi:hypothetical protein